MLKIASSIGKASSIKKDIKREGSTSVRALIGDI